MFSKKYTELISLEIPVSTTGTDPVSKTLYSVQNSSNANIPSLKPFGMDLWNQTVINGIFKVGNPYT